MAPIRKVALSILTICWLSTTYAQRNFLVISDIHLDDSKDQAAILPGARNAGIDTWDTAIKSAQPLSQYIGQMDSASLRQMIDTLYNTGVKAHNKDLDIDVKRQ